MQRVGLSNRQSKQIACPGDGKRRRKAAPFDGRLERRLIAARHPVAAQPVAQPVAQPDAPPEHHLELGERQQRPKRQPDARQLLIGHVVGPSTADIADAAVERVANIAHHIGVRTQNRRRQLSDKW